VTDGRKANGKWVDRWHEGGVKRQRTFDRKGDRDAFRRERVRRQQLGDVVIVAADVSLAEFVEEWWTEYALVELERSTRAAYAHTWEKHLRPRLGRYGLRQLDTDVVLALRQTLVSNGVGAPTIAKSLAVLQSILSFAVLKKRIAANPVAKVRKPAVAPDRQVVPIPPATVEDLRARLGPRDATLVSVLAYAGLRPQEALALHGEDVDDRKIFVHRKVVDGELLGYTKTRRNRWVRLLGPLAQDLAEYRLASGRRDGLLFPRADGEPWRAHDWRNWHRRVYRPNAEAVGLVGARPYDLRGSFVSLLVWEGQTIVEVSRQAGHSVATSDRHYARMFEDFDPDRRLSAEAVIRAARQPGGRGMDALFDREVGRS
jgi:integrase